MNRRRPFELTPRRRQLAGVVLCLLVALFAIAAKVSWYRAQPAAGKAIVSMKVAKADAPMVDSVTHQAPDAAPVAALFFAALAALFCLTGAGISPADAFVPRPQPAFARRAFARPPPVR